MSRFVDRGANVAAIVGIGMALTIGVSFLMVIPIDPAYLVLAPLSGLLIGWYGNQRAGQLRGRPGRIFANAAWSGAITARGALIYLANGTTNPTVCVLDFGADKTSTTTFTVQFPAVTNTSAIIRIS